MEGSGTAEGAKRRFLELLNNRDKQRTSCLVVAIDGQIDGEPLTDLAPAQEWCFDEEQTWNTCYTLRYRADGKGRLAEPLARQMVADVAAVARAPERPEEKAQEQGSAAPGQTGPRAPLGVVRRQAPSKWKALESEVGGLHEAFGELADRMLVALGPNLDSTLKKGLRFVVFCEIENRPSLATLGLADDELKQLVELMPERFVLVIAGADLASAATLEPPLERITVGDDYLAPSPPADRSQPLASDRPEGEDRLEVTGEVNALADAIASREMDPPLVLGILGGWGSGKSYVMHLLEKRLLAIRAKDIRNPDVRASFPYVGHFYPVWFNAWTYAKDDLWSSLMQRLLLALNDQIAYEQYRVAAAADRARKEKREDPDASADELDGLRRELYALEKKARRRIDELAAPLLEEHERSEAGAEADLDDGSRKLLEESRELLASALEKARKESPGDPLAWLGETAGEGRGIHFERKFEVLLAGEAVFTPQVAERLASGESARSMLRHLDNEILWKRLRGVRRELLAELEEEERKLREERARLARTRAQSAEAVEAELRRERWDRWADGLAGYLGRRLKEEVGASRGKGGGAGDGEAEGTAFPLDRAVESIGFLGRIRGGFSGSTALLFLAFVGLGALAVHFGERVHALWAALAGVVGGGVEAWGRANRWLEQRLTAFQTFENEVRAREEERRQALLAERRGDEERSQEERVARLEAQVESFRRKIGLTAGHTTLLEFIVDRLEEGGYEERLGLLHQVEEDIDFLTSSLLSKELTAPDGQPAPGIDVDQILFPRGRPRVVLFIDDLDRCPPPRVVEVFEAVQLLVSTELFVVVLAMDVRYITKALEQAYPGVLDRRGAPSGLDYTEKIVQVPYRIRPISEDAMPGYLRSQMAVRGPEAKEQAGEEGGGGGATVALSGISEPGVGAVRIDRTIPPAVLAFEEEEAAALGRCALAVSVGPRATKRLVNVMKMIKIIWYRTGVEVSIEVEKTVLFFLALSAGYPAVMRYVLLELEAVATSGGERGERDLPTLLEEIAARWGDVEGRRTEWDFLRAAGKRTELLPEGMTVAKLGRRNVDLIHSFSFVGEVDLPRDTIPHQVSLSLGRSVEMAPLPDDDER